MSITTERLIKPSRAVVSNFVITIVNFLREKLGEDVYANLRISDPMKKVSQNLSSIVGFSSLTSKSLEDIFNELQEAGIEVEDVSSKAGNPFVSLKISLHLPEAFLRGYGDSSVLVYCDEYDDTEPTPSPAIEVKEEENPPPVKSTPISDEEEEEEEGSEDIITTISELEEYIKDLTGIKKAREVSNFFKWHLEQNGIVSYETMPRGAYKFSGHEPECVFRITEESDILKAQKVFSDLGCEVDLRGDVGNVVRIKSFHPLEPPKDDKKERVSKKTSTSAPAPVPTPAYPDGVSPLIKELLDEIAGLEGKARSRKISTFFIGQIPGTMKVEVLPRTTSTFLLEDGTAPEFVCRFKNFKSAGKIAEVFEELGCEVDIMGESEDILRVKSLVKKETTKTPAQKTTPEIKQTPPISPPVISSTNTQGGGDVLYLLEKALQERDLSEQELLRLRKLSELKQREANLFAEIGTKLLELAEVQSSLKEIK